VRIGVCIPQAGPYGEVEVQRRLAAEIERLGFDSLWVSDHVIVPAGERYIPEDMLEPLALLSWLAAATSRLTLGLSVLVLPYRDPVVTAKALSTIDVLSSGRLVVGVGAGWLEREFEALSASFAERGPVTDEYLRVIRNLWETDTSSFSGRWKRYQDMRCFPKASPGRGGGTIPLLVGGNARPSIRRAAELGDGWHPINQSPAQLEASIAEYRAACERFGRAPGPVVLRHMPGGRTAPEGTPLAGSVDQQRHDLAAYEQVGCDELLLSWATRSPDDLLDRLGAFLHDVARR
jgi:probable F420-dependent oxidoreductase